ncbi:MAG TPA: hypothetical protein VLI54_06440 [Bacillota bacterium]|nr:hypothetical protein [Bacillota bacterium]
MFKVDVTSIQEYLAFDPNRQSDLSQLDALLRTSLPKLERWFYDGIHDATGGMHMQLVGYGAFKYLKSGKQWVTWPVVGLALQKNYFSLYFCVYKADHPIVDDYRGKLGEKRSGHNNISFVSFGSINLPTFKALLSEVEYLVETHPESVR